MANLKSTSAAENLYMQLNASELSAIIMKGSPHSNDRDAGFCSGSSEGGDDFSIDHSRLEPSSPPTDASEDSVEVKVAPIALVRNKRKSSEPSKVVCERDDSNATIPTPPRSLAAASQSTGPLKKRIRYTSNTDSAVVLTPPTVPLTSPPPQLWDPSQVLPHELMPNPAQVFVRHPGVTTLHRLPPDNGVGEQEEPLALVLKKPAHHQPAHGADDAGVDDDDDDDDDGDGVDDGVDDDDDDEGRSPYKSSEAANATVSSPAPDRSPRKGSVPTTRSQREEEEEEEEVGGGSEVQEENLEKGEKEEKPLSLIASQTNVSTVPTPCSSGALSVASSQAESSSSKATKANGSGASASRPQQRNYKNMTRERRIEANARERTRVHTISAAYETLRRAVPSYSNAQKLSKLSVLRVACSYILTLSRMAGYDYSEDQSQPSISSCFEAVTATIQTEGKIRKKKEE